MVLRAKQTAGTEKPKMVRTVTAATLRLALLFPAGGSAIVVGVGNGVYIWVKGELIHATTLNPI